MGVDADAQALWLELLQQVAGRAAHEIKGALNGVALNLEVVRSRSEGEGPASRVASFAETAAGELEAVIGMTEALLALARPPRSPGNVRSEVKSLGALLAPAAGVAGTPLKLEVPADGSGETAVGGLVVRVVVAAAILAALDRGAGATLSTSGTDALELTLFGDDGVAPSLDSRVAALATSAGIQLGGDGKTLTLTFPPRREGPTRETV